MTQGFKEPFVCNRKVTFFWKRRNIPSFSIRATLKFWEKSGDDINVAFLVGKLKHLVKACTTLQLLSNH